MDHIEHIWSVLKQRRKEGEEYPLRILIMGPADDGTIEYKTRCKLKKILQNLGHGAVFPEDLCKQAGAWDDELLGEVIIQAREAHIIIMIYRTRGTQSERDILMSDILNNPGFAQKSIVFIEEAMLEKVKNSVTGQDWENMSKVTEIHTYQKTKLPKDIVDNVQVITQKLRRRVYVRDILRGAIV
jgi:hypothetical protein